MLPVELQFLDAEFSTKVSNLQREHPDAALRILGIPPWNALPATPWSLFLETSYKVADYLGSRIIGRQVQYSLRFNIKNLLEELWDLFMSLGPVFFAGIVGPPVFHQQETLEAYLMGRAMLGFVLIHTRTVKHHMRISSCLLRRGVSLELLRSRWTLASGVYLRLHVKRDDISYVGQAAVLIARHKSFLAAIRGGGRTLSEVT